MAIESSSEEVDAPYEYGPPVNQKADLEEELDNLSQNDYTKFTKVFTFAMSMIEHRLDTEINNVQGDITLSTALRIFKKAKEDAFDFINKAAITGSLKELVKKAIYINWSIARAKFIIEYFNAFWKPPKKRTLH